MVLHNCPEPFEQIENVVQGFLDGLNGLIFVLLLVLHLEMHTVLIYHSCGFVLVTSAEKIRTRDAITMHVSLLGDAARENLATSEVNSFTRRTSDSDFFSLLFLDNFLVLFEEIFEVCCDA